MIHISQFAPAIAEDYENVSKLYHQRKKKRNLFIFNTLFVIVLVALILMDVKWFTFIIALFILLILYGILRLSTL